MITFNKQMIEKTSWQKTDAKVLFQWAKHGLMDGGNDLKFRKYFGYGLAGCIFFAPPIIFLTQASSLNEALMIIITSIILLGFFASIVLFGILGGHFHAYRLTEKGIEYAWWSDQVAIGRVIAMGFIWFILCFLAIFFVLDPSSILVSLGGMVGVGLMAGATLFSKQYEETHLDYHYHQGEWDHLFNRVKIDQKRRIIITRTSTIENNKPRYQMYSLFCTANNFDAVSKLIIQKAEQKGLDIVYGEAFTDS